MGASDSAPAGVILGRSRKASSTPGPEATCARTRGLSTCPPSWNSTHRRTCASPCFPSWSELERPRQEHFGSDGKAGALFALAVSRANARQVKAGESASTRPRLPSRDISRVGNLDPPIGYERRPGGLAGAGPSGQKRASRPRMRVDSCASTASGLKRRIFAGVLAAWMQFCARSYPCDACAFRSSRGKEAPNGGF